MFYRFIDGVFIEAETFEEAKQKRIDKIMRETENHKRWHNCTCLGLGHQTGCKEMEGIIPF